MKRDETFGKWTTLDDGGFFAHLGVGYSAYSGVDEPTEVEGQISCYLHP